MSTIKLLSTKLTAVIHVSEHIAINELVASTQLLHDLIDGIGERLAVLNDTFHSLVH